MQEFLDFMKQAEAVTSERRKITRRPLVQLLYLHKIIDPFITLLSDKQNFLNQTLDKDGLILSYAEKKNNPDKKTIDETEKLLKSILDYTSRFMNDLSYFRKMSRKYLEDLGLIGIIDESDSILKRFLDDYKDMPKTFKAFKVLLERLIDNLLHGGRELKSYEVAAMRTFCNDLHTKYLNSEQWIKKLVKLKQDFYFKNGVISREMKLLEQATKKQADIERFMLNKDNCSQFLVDGDVIMSYKLYNYIQKDWFTKVVNRVTKSATTHAGIYYHNGKVAEARQKGSSVQLNDIHAAKNEVLIVLRPYPNLTGEQRSEIRKRIEFYCQLDNGKPKYGYNWKGLAGFFIARKYRWFSGLLPANKAFFCSELVAQIYKDIGIQLTPFKEPALVSPKDLLESKMLKFLYVIDATSTFRKNIEEKKNDMQDMISQAKKILNEKMVGVQY